MAKSVTVEIPIIEINGVETVGLDSPQLIIKSHNIFHGWNGRVHIIFDDLNITVDARDLEDAANRCRDIK